jgi:hypothetical protein
MDSDLGNMEAHQMKTIFYRPYKHLEENQQKSYERRIRGVGIYHCINGYSDKKYENSMGINRLVYFFYLLTFDEILSTNSKPSNV